MHWLTDLGLTYTEGHNLLATAWSVHAAGGIEHYSKIVATATVRQAEVKAYLEALVEQLDGPVRDCVEEARRFLQKPDSRSACLALTCATRAQTRCEVDDDAGRDLCAAARIAVRDVLVWRVQLNCLWGDRDAFMEALEQAYGRPLDHTSLSRILHAHGKLIGDNFPSSFLSKCKREAEARGRKRADKGKQKKGAAMDVEEDA